MRKAKQAERIVSRAAIKVVEAIEEGDSGELRKAWGAMGAKARREMAENSDLWAFAGIAASQEGDAATLRKIIGLGWDISETDPEGASAGHWAAGAGQEQCLRILLEAGWDPESRDRDGTSAGHWAARGWLGQGDPGDAPECLRLLIGAGWSPSARDSLGDTAGHWAAAFGREENLRALRRAGWDPAEENRKGWTAGHMAAERGHPMAMALLLEMGWDPAARGSGSQRGPSALEISREWGHSECVELLEAAELSGKERVSIGKSSKMQRGIAKAKAPGRGM